VHKKLKWICRRLNLQPYAAGSPERPVKFYTPTELVVTRECVHSPSLSLSVRVVLTPRRDHHIQDGRLYLSNCARLFPCEQPLPEYVRSAPLMCDACGKAPCSCDVDQPTLVRVMHSVEGSRLVRLLRPEFVRKYTRPLCSQAYKCVSNAIHLSLSRCADLTDFMAVLRRTLRPARLNSKSTRPPHT
jgi:hypothetical protein